MNCLQNFPRSFALPLQTFKCHKRNSFLSSINELGMLKPTEPHSRLSVKANSGSKSEMEKIVVETEDEDEKSETYSNTMTEAMGAVLTYRHELGMNYNFILPDLIVGSCLQTPEDVDKLRKIGVKTVFCLQQDPDLEYFGVDIKAIQEYAKKCGDIQHLRAQIRDFDGFDLRMRLPAVLGILYKAINRNGGVTYIHCTAGLGRAPAVAMAYMFWVQGYKLDEAKKLLLSKRSCFPNSDAIRSATADILTGFVKKPVTFRWKDNNCSTVEISGLDIGWGQRIPLEFNKDQGSWVLTRELPEGNYEYKYIVNGEWIHNEFEPIKRREEDGLINNYVQVVSDNLSSVNTKLRERLTSEDPDLTSDERTKVIQFLESPAE